MGVYSYELEVTSSIAPAKLFKALVLDSDTLLPKILPQAIQSIQILEGDGGPGTVRLTTFVEGSHLISIKQRVDELDKLNFIYKYTIVEGVYGDVVESVASTVKVEASGDGGSVIKNISVYVTKGGAKLDEELLKSAKGKSSGIYKAIEGYLVANPDYN